MPTLVLFRHAKAAQALPGQRDFDRPLIERGRRDARRTGAVLAGLGLQTALVSAAIRTRETWEIASGAFETPPEAEIDHDLYLCGGRRLIRRLHEVPAEVRKLVVVGHNPDMQEVALWLAGRDESAAARSLRHKFPTAAAAIFDIDSESWDEFEPRQARLKRFVLPAELEG